MTSLVLAVLIDIFHCHVHILIFFRSRFNSRPVWCSLFTTEKEGIICKKLYSTQNIIREIIYIHKEE